MVRPDAYWIVAIRDDTEAILSFVKFHGERMPFSQFSHQQMQAQRRAYAYPAVALGGSLGNFTVANFQTTQELDQYLNGLLLAQDDDQKILGYLGVIFWGHYSSQDGRIRRERALGKVNLAYIGRDRVVKGRKQRMRGVLDIGIDVAAGYISTASDYIQDNQYDRALSTLKRLPQIQIAFASKLCAFINPLKCGVIDSVIAEKYPQLGFALANEYVKDSVNNRNQYNQYCNCLQATATALNSNPRYSSWSDRNKAQLPWRAVDVERALYTDGT